MGWKFNPFTGALDQTGSGGGGGASYIDGEVQNFSALPETLGSPAVDSAYLVREAEGTWLLGRKPAGIYIRTANTGTRASDWTYAGEFPDVFNDANFVLYDNGDSTKNLQFQLSGIATGTTRTITVPDKNVTLDDAGDSRTPTAHTHVSADITDATDAATANAIVRRDATQGAKFGGSLDAVDIYASGIVDGYMFVENGFSIGSKYAAISHTHGNITNDGKVGVTAGLPLKTGTAGAVEAGAFGTGAGEFAEGNHTHTQLHDKSHAMTDVTSHTAGNHKVFYSNGSGEIVELALGNSGEVLTSNGATSAPSFAAASGGGVTTGSVDNAILRADGTGGSTSQSSDLVIDDATTSTQANIALVNNHSETNSALVLSPKGTGAFIIGPKPDGTSTGGNARGLKAVDLSHQRTNAADVASGNYSVIIGGDRCRAQGTATIAGGERAIASTAYAVAFGRVATASGTAAGVFAGQDGVASGAESAVISGSLNTASAFAAVAFGNYTLADRSGLIAQANGSFAAGATAVGDAQWIHMVLRAKTTTNSAVELLINNARTTNGRLTCPSGKIISGIINIHGVKSDGTASAHYVRQFQVKNVGGTSSYPYAAVTIGTDYASSTSITFNDPDTNGDALSVSVTGIASETWRWTAHVSAVETTYGS